MVNHVLYLNHKISFSDEGEGKVIVLIHGFLESREIWLNYIEILSKKYRVIAIDLPGHGRSDVFYKIHSMEMMAKAVKHVLDVLEIKKCVMAGHSMGGYVTLAFAELFARQLKGVAMINSSTLADSIEKKKDRLRAVELIQNDRLNYITELINKLFAQENLKKFKKEGDELKRIARNTRKDGATAALLGMRERHDRTTILQQIKVPFFFVYGMKDIVVSFEKNLPLAMLPKKNYISISEHSGHLSFIEDRETTLIKFKEFLKICYKK